VIFAQTRRAGPALLAAFFFAACAAPPRPKPESLALASNAPAIVEGRVTDRQGRPVAAIRVQALPRGETVGWSPPAATDAQGHFLLSVIAPAEYGFLLSWRGRVVITPEKDDPARQRISVSPGDRRSAVELIFLREAWETLE
jgi:hypothetical protein